MKTLITVFSAEGNTLALAKDLAAATGFDLYEIVPQAPYTAADINWKNPLSRCNKEYFGKKDVPVAAPLPDLAAYDRVLVGFPIWYGCAPNVVHTFCDQLDWTGKEVLAFATSGGSPIGKTADKLAPHTKGAKTVTAVLVHSAQELEKSL